MEKILKELTDLLGIVKVRIVKCDAEREQLAQARSALDNREKGLEVAEKAVSEREKNVVIYEDIDGVKKELTLAVKASKEESKRLKALEAKLEAQRIANEKALSDAQADIERQKEKLAKQSIEIDKKAKDYRKEVMAEITKQAGK